LKDITT